MLWASRVEPQRPMESILCDTAAPATPKPRPLVMMRCPRRPCAAASPTRSGLAGYPRRVSLDFRASAQPPLEMLVVPLLCHTFDHHAGSGIAELRETAELAVPSSEREEVAAGPVVSWARVENTFSVDRGSEVREEEVAGEAQRQCGPLASTARVSPKSLNDYQGRLGDGSPRYRRIRRSSSHASSSTSVSAACEADADSCVETVDRTPHSASRYTRPKCVDSPMSTVDTVRGVKVGKLLRSSSVASKSSHNESQATTVDTARGSKGGRLVRSSSLASKSSAGTETGNSSAGGGDCHERRSRIAMKLTSELKDSWTPRTPRPSVRSGKSQGQFTPRRRTPRPSSRDSSGREREEWLGSHRSSTMMLMRASSAASIRSVDSRASSSSRWSTRASGRPGSAERDTGQRQLSKVGAKLGSFVRRSIAVVSTPSWPSAPALGNPLAPPFNRDNAVIILDWDDTLIATHFIQHVIAPGPPINERECASPIPPHSPYYEALLSHARVVDQVLRKAREVARVAVVTLACKQWFEKSAARYFPSFDLCSVLQELQIEVFHADRQSPLAKALAQAGSDPSRVAKKTAMTSCLKKMYSGSPEQWNVVSIGDSACEREALKECLKSLQKDKRNGPALCKTVKMRSNPTLKQLTGELESLLQKLQSLVLWNASFDRHADGSLLMP